MARVAARFGLGSTVAAGIAAGVIFAVFEMIAAALLMGAGATFMPLRMIGAMVLGSAALDPGYSLAVAATAGVAVHMVLSIVFAAVFASVASWLTGGGIATPGAFALAGILFGVGLWLLNFYVVAPLAGWTWFPERTQPGVQFVAHAFFFGCPVGWMLGRSQPLTGEIV